VIAIALLGTAACGGNGGGRLSKSEYESKLGELAGSLSGDLTAFSAFDPSDLKSAPAFMRRIAETLDDFAESLSPIEPPRAVEGQHARLIEGARSGATSIRRLAQKLERADEAQAKRLLAQLTPSRLQGLRELQKAAAELAAKGYRVSSTAGT
jgi:hypothetical protein